MHRKFVTSVLFVLAIGLLAACGGAPAASTGPAGSAATAVPAGSNPQDLGNQVGQLYFQALEDATNLVKAKPDPATVKPQLEALKEKYIQQLVTLGRQWATLSKADVGRAQFAVTGWTGKFGTADWYQPFQDAQTHYNNTKGGSDIASLMSSFFIIGQYADFELLKQQNPAEAKRLGIQ